MRGSAPGGISPPGALLLLTREDLKQPRRERPRHRPQQRQPAHHQAHRDRPPPRGHRRHIAVADGGQRLRSPPRRITEGADRRARGRVFVVVDGERGRVAEQAGRQARVSDHARVQAQPRPAAVALHRRVDPHHAQRTEQRQDQYDGVQPVRADEARSLPAQPQPHRVVEPERQPGQQEDGEPEFPPDRVVRQYDEGVPGQENQRGHQERQLHALLPVQQPAGAIVDVHRASIAPCLPGPTPTTRRVRAKSYAAQHDA